ncbi:hypothetical protein B0J13DRAFT_658425 [Dactylonectria estremocensis]|uniref:Uncharacterized protein n=1 Tax=Dactylonectria estremocensis TaxID=1079267 RepID=A0A9P9JCH8_9HYPO|nr:hypothetical protein B0J13DRAFT_658425 [Dactylonectria estremocensis]
MAGRGLFNVPNMVKLLRDPDVHSIRVDVVSNYPSEWEMVEVIWSRYSPITQRVLPIVRVFLNKASVEMFAFMYKKVFEMLRMLSLLDVESEVEYLLLVKQLEGRPWKSCFEVIRMLMANTQIAEPGLRHWAAHKSHPVIGSGLNQACSEISPEDWNLFCSHALETLDGEPSQWSQQSNSPKSHIKKRVGHNISRHMLTSPRRADYDLNLLSTDRTYLQMGIQQGHSDTSSNYESGRGQKSEISLEIRQQRRGGSVIRDGITSRYGTPLSESHAGSGTPEIQIKKEPMSSQPSPIVTSTEKTRSQSPAQRFGESTPNLERKWQQDVKLDLLREATRLINEKASILEEEKNLVQKRKRLRQKEAEFEQKGKKLEEEGYLDPFGGADDRFFGSCDFYST